MEAGGSMTHSQRLSNNPFPEPNQPNSSYLFPIYIRSILILSSHLRLGLPKGFFPVGSPVKILKALLASFILAAWPVHLNLIDTITLNILGERYKLLSTSLWYSPFASLLGPTNVVLIIRELKIKLNLWLTAPKGATPVN